MLEILILRIYWQKMGELAKEKRRDPLRFQLLVVLLWLLTQLFVGATSSIILDLVDEEQTLELVLAFYFLALVCAVVVTWIFFRFVKGLPINEPV